MSEQAGKLVGVEVSNLVLRAVCLNQSGEATDLHEVAIDRRESITSQLISFINEIKPRFGDFGTRIGVAVSGLIDRRTNRVALSRHTPEYVAVDLAAEIRKANGLQVLLENDANAAAYGEFALGAGQRKAQYFLCRARAAASAARLSSKANCGAAHRVLRANSVIFWSIPKKICGSKTLPIRLIFCAASKIVFIRTARLRWSKSEKTN